MGAIQSLPISNFAWDRQTLKKLAGYWLQMCLWISGLQNDHLKLSKLFMDWKYRSSLGNGIAFLTLNFVQTTLRAIRLLLVPEVFGRYFIANVTLHLIYELFTLIKKSFIGWTSTLTLQGRKRTKLLKQLKAANTFAERQAVGQVLDQLEGNDRWRQEPESQYYDYKRILNKIRSYKKLQIDNDIIGIMFYLRQGLLRKHWGLSNPRLYSRSYVGTKHIVEEYMETVVQCMETIIQSEPDENSKEELSLENKLAFFNETRHAFGRSALLLSGGGASGLYHAGVIKVLSKHNLLPTVISGASAGSIVASIVGVRTDEEISNCFAPGILNFRFFGANIDYNDMENTSPSCLKHLPEKMKASTIFQCIAEMSYIVYRFTQKQYVLDINILGKCLQHNIGQYTFREAFDRTGRIINVTITPTDSSDYPQLLNYLTAPNVLVWSACLASCAIPWIYSPVELLAKDKYGNTTPYCPEGLKWSDGSVECDLPMERLSELFNVNHFIVSQVNIHYKLISGYSSYGSGRINNLMSFLKKQMKAYIKHIVELGLDTTVLKLLGVGLVPLLTQRYEGDITICANEKVPLATIFRKVLSNPSVEEFDEMLKISERATWPYISRIRTMCRIEFALERAVRRLRGELAFQDAKQGISLSRVPSFYTSQSQHNLDKLALSRTEGFTPEQRIRRNRSMNVAGAVMTIKNPDNISESKSWTS